MYLHPVLRDRRKKNVAIYNLPEAKDREADKLSASSLLETAYGLKCPINRVICLGRRIENKHRPLLVCFECIDDKAIVVSRSYLLCHHDQFKKVFVVLDRTKIECEKHKRLVTELKKKEIWLDDQKWQHNC